ncbi:hypothetical protein HanHA300_Chr01g0034251 [Helianthus annuus]|nr:hypothetical protein HanHA300_Chr01g0034251 [Helianthus annuus]KAJ0628498.1 hypothetical protein HanHA89_Chr01g0037211 [Helianthus annuus]KAJ0784747.1 hypothetical protein HanLR1_Chr01g0035331 [Helianthus annuus]
MADALVSALVSEVVRTLSDAAKEEFALFRAFSRDILALKEDFKQIQAVLEDAEEKQVKEKAVELWLRRLRSASMKVEDVLDEVKTEALLRRLHKEINIERGIKYKLRIEDCNGLLSLPDEIQSFKDLNKLEITRCKHLNKRCKREKGEDWHKISHIPDLSIEAPFSSDDDDDDSDDEEETDEW